MNYLSGIIPVTEGFIVGNAGVKGRATRTAGEFAPRLTYR